MKQKNAKPSRPVLSSTPKSKTASKARSSQRRVSTPDVMTAATPPGSVPSVVQHAVERRQESTPASEVRAVRRIDASSAAEYQRMYAAAWTADGEGRLQLDVQRFAQALADTLVDPLTEQDVYSWALLAAAEGHSALFNEDPILSELKAAS